MTTVAKAVRRVSGYAPCDCRDCFEVAIASPGDEPVLCWACREAGCDGGECKVDSAYDAADFACAIEHEALA